MFRAKFHGAIAVAAIMLAGLPLQAQTATATKVISDQILPQDTYMYVSVPNVAEMKTFVMNSNMGQLWQDPSLDDFKQDVMAAIDDDLQDNLLKFQDAVGLSMEEVLAIPTGEVSMAFSAGPENTVGVVFFLDYGSSEAEIRDLLDQATNGLAQNPRLTIRDENFDGTAITMFDIDHRGPAPTPLAKEFGWFQKDQRMVFSNRIELLEGVLENWEGDASQSFRTNEAYSFILKECESRDGSAMSKVYFDPIGLFTKLVQTGSLGQASMGAGMALGFLPALGLNQMKAMGAISEPGTGDFEAVSRSIFYAEQPAMGLMKAFKLDHCQKVPPNWVKENVTTYIATKWKIDEAFDSIESIVDMFSGAGTLAKQLDQLSETGPGIHLKHDVVDLMSGDAMILTAPSENPDLPGDQMLVSLGVRNNEQAADLLARIADQGNIDSREFRGAELYETDGPTPGQSISFTVSDGRLFIGVGGTLIEQVLRNDSDVRPLAQSAEFQKVSQFFPANAVAVQFTRPAETYRSFYEMLKSGEVADNFPGNQDVLAKIDFTKLPPFEVLSKYIKPSGGYTVNNEHGMFMEAFQLKD